jgi:hypothetical protein
MIRRLGKRGQEDKIYFLIWELIVLVMVIVALTVAVRGISNNTNYWKRYQSADLAMITELTYAGQGDFVVNYNMKQMKMTTTSKALLVVTSGFGMLSADTLSFQTFLKSSSFWVYDKSSDEDKFPQSFMFAASKNIKVLEGNHSTDFLVLYRTGDTLGLQERYVTTASLCPTAITQKDMTGLKFDVIALDDESKDRASYAGIMLKQYGASANPSSAGKELVIFLSTDTASGGTPGTVAATKIYYYDGAQAYGEKLACLMGLALKTHLPDKTFETIKYDGSFDADAGFIGVKDNYARWIILKYDKSLDRDNFGLSIKEALIEYYK